MTLWHAARHREAKLAYERARKAHRGQRKALERLQAAMTQWLRSELPKRRRRA